MKNIHGTCAALVLALSAVGMAQDDTVSDAIGGPLTGPTVIGAPFSANAVATLVRQPSDALPRELFTTLRFFRNAAGAVRVEQAIADPVTGLPGRQSIVAIAGPGESVIALLDPATRTIRRVPRSILGFSPFNGGSDFVLPISAVHFRAYHMQNPASIRDTTAAAADSTKEDLGTRRTKGVETNGTRLTITVAPYTVGNDKPFDVINEKWISLVLRLVMAAHSIDARSGVLDYAITDLDRREPPAKLFKVPEDYTLKEPTNPTAEDTRLMFDYWPEPGRRTRRVLSTK